MATTFDVLYLGVLPLLDPVEGNVTAENAGALTGMTVGSASDPLAAYQQQWSPGSYSGGNPGAYDSDNSVSNDTFRIDGGALQTWDVEVRYTITITYTDGTTSVQDLSIAQDTDGNTYLFPEVSNNSANAALGAKPIRSLTFGSPIAAYDAGADRVNPGYTDGSIVQGSTGNDTMTSGYVDGDGDQINDSNNTIYGDAGNDTIDARGGNDSVYGGSGNDTLSGGTGNDTLYGGTGNDTLTGGSGNDLNFGGDGDDLIDDEPGAASNTSADTVYGGAGGDTIYTSGGDDVVYGGADNDVIDGEDGNDRLFGDAGDDLVSGGLGNDTLYGGAGNDGLYGGDGVDNMMAEAGDDTVDGGSGDDWLSGGSGNDTLYGGIGNDYLGGADGTDQLYGGAGNDLIVGDSDLLYRSDYASGPGVGATTLTVVNASDARVDLYRFDGAGNTTFVTSIPAGGSTVQNTFADQNFVLRDPVTNYFAQTIRGGVGQTYTFGTHVDDTLQGGDGDDTLLGQWGSDTLDGGLGNDSLYGGSGNDELRGSAGIDTIDGGSGSDTVDYSGNNSSFTVDLQANTVFGGDTDGDVISNLENVRGTNFGDTITLSERSGTVWAGSGADTLRGGANDDVIYAGAGNDFIEAFGGDDLVYGGDGDDYIDDVVGSDDGTGRDTFYGEGGNDTIFTGNDADLAYGGTGNDTIDGEDGDDTLHGDDGRDLMFGSAGNDTLFGGAGDDTLSGGDGDDVLSGGSGGDSLAGDAGNDALSGGDDADALDGGTGNDTLSGDAGDDSLFARAGDDTLFGGAGSDVHAIFDGAGTVTITGGEDPGDTDVDTLQFNDSGSNGVTVIFTGNEAGTFAYDGAATSGTFTQIEWVDASEGGDLIDASATTQTQTLSGYFGDDSIIGGSGDDDLMGEAGNDTIDGGAGADYLSGGFGDDSLAGNLGDDSLFGDAGADVLRGGAGNDTLEGGADGDIFVFDRGGGDDIVTDFDLGDADADGFYNDQLDVSTLRTPGGDPITAWDVTVLDDGFGNAKLVFPEGETVVLQGVAPSQMATANQRYRAGIPCFTPGTQILTATGPRPVEALRPGDLIQTRDNGLQPLVWVGMRRLGPEELAVVPHLRPVRIAPGALGNDRALVVSPQHGVLTAAARGQGTQLVRAAHLARMAGGRARVMQGRRGVTYVHLLFDAHQIVWSNDLPSESFYPGPQALAMLHPPELREVLQLFPDLAQGAAAAIGARARPLARWGALPSRLRDLHAAPL